MFPKYTYITDRIMRCCITCTQMGIFKNIPPNIRTSLMREYTETRLSQICNMWGCKYKMIMNRNSNSFNGVTQFSTAKLNYPFERVKIVYMTNTDIKILTPGKIIMWLKNNSKHTIYVTWNWLYSSLLIEKSIIISKYF